MDVKFINPFIEAFHLVMPQLGFSQVEVGKLSAKSKGVDATGVLIVLGIVGDVKGNVVYTIGMDVAKQIASTMMMGMPVEEFDEMASSAISELTNMLTANAATILADAGVMIDISTPTLLHGDNVNVKMAPDPILCVRLTADGNPVDINITLDK